MNTSSIYRYCACWSTNGPECLHSFLEAMLLTFLLFIDSKPYINVSHSLFCIPFKKGIKTLHKSLVFLLKDAFKIFLLSKELKPFIKVTISLYRIPFIKGIEILYKGLAFPHKFVNFYSEMKLELGPVAELCNIDAKLKVRQTMIMSCNG